MLVISQILVVVILVAEVLVVISEILVVVILVAEVVVVIVGGEGCAN